MQAQDVATYEGRLAKVVGPARSGKTLACALRCKHLIEKGVKPEQILVVVTTGAAARAFRARLQGLMGADMREKAARICVSRAIDVCEQVMNDPRVTALTGRRARVLTDTEYTFFLEDLKTLGQKNQRLHNMLLFFFAQWSNMEQEPDWLLRGEETDLLAYARRVLTSLGGTLRHELPYLCANFLASEQGAPFGQRFSHVLVDDFQNLSHAEQTCMALLARGQLMAFGRADAAVKANTDYPNPEGFERFERVRKGAEVLELAGQVGPAGALTFERALGGEVAGTAGSREGAAFVAWDTPDEELAGICGLVDAWCAADSSRSPADVVVAVPTRRWGGFVEKALASHGHKVDATGLGRKLGGDPREAGMHAAASAWVKLRLLCDEADPLAWRAWTGFDNAITNSEAWAHVYKLAWDEGKSVCEVLDEVAAGTAGMLKGELVREKLHEGRSFIAQAHGLRGHELVHAVGLDAVPGTGALISCLPQTADAHDLLCALHAWLEGASEPEGNAVHIALFENLVGQDFPLAVMAGMVDGMVPGKDVFDIGKTDDVRAKALADDRVRTRIAAGAAAKALIVSTFGRTTVEIAERSKMQVARITAVPGGRVALVSTSQLLKEAGVEPVPADNSALADLLA